MRGPETRLRKRIQTGLQKEFPTAYFRKIHGNQFQNRGIMDLIGCVYGVFIGLEIKRPRGKGATEIQKFEIRQVRRAGGSAWVVRDTPTAIKAVRLAIEKVRGKEWLEKNHNTMSQK